MNSQHRAHVFAGSRLFGQLLLGFDQRQAGHVQRAVGALDGGDAFAVEAATLQAFAVDAAGRPCVSVPTMR